MSAPAKPQSAYMHYVTSVRSSVALEFPELEFFELANVLSERWKYMAASGVAAAPCIGRVSVGDSKGPTMRNDTLTLLLLPFSALHKGIARNPPPPTHSQRFPQGAFVLLKESPRPPPLADCQLLAIDCRLLGLTANCWR